MPQGVQPSVLLDVAMDGLPESVRAARVAHLLHDEIELLELVGTHRDADDDHGVPGLGRGRTYLRLPNRNVGNIMGTAVRDLADPFQTAGSLEVRRILTEG